jgi:hypothetical protein
MAETLYFVHEDDAVLEELAAPYRDRGWGVVLSSPSDPDALDRLVDAAPLAAVFLLDGGSAAACTVVAEAATADPHGVHPLMVFLGGSTEEVVTAKMAVPQGIFVQPSELPWVLKHLAFKD